MYLYGINLCSTSQLCSLRLLYKLATTHHALRIQIEKYSRFVGQREIVLEKICYEKSP